MKLLGNLTNQDKTVFQTATDNKAVTITPTATLTGASLTLTLPNPASTTDTLVSRTSTDTLSNKTLTTPVLGVATATSINKVAITAPATSATLTIADGKTLTASNSITLAGTDGKALSLAGNLTTSGASDVTFTFTGATNVTFPTSGTLAANSAATPTAAGIVTSYVPVVQSAINTVTNANYTILTTDGYHTILMSTGNTDRTVTLPAASANDGREFVIKKIDSGTGKVTITRAGSDTIDANTTRVLVNQYDSIKLGCDGTSNFPVIIHPQTILTENDGGTANTAGAATVTQNIFGAASGLGVTLQPGTWLLSGQATLVAVAGTAQSVGTGECVIGIGSTEDATTGTVTGDSNIGMQSLLTNAQISAGIRMLQLTISGFKVSVTSATPYYLNGYHGYAGNVPEWYGRITAECVG